MKFPVKQDKTWYATNSNLSYGPTFGGRYDLHTFNGTVNTNSFGKFFPLNGSAKFGHSYDMQGVHADDINNGNLNVIELEVYKVTLRKPWRSHDNWDTKEFERLKGAILAFTPIPDLSISKVRVAMIGPVGAGKSSFFNTIDSIFHERITWRACSSSAEHSVTAGYVPYTIRPNSGGSPNFILCDMPGLEESVGPDVNDCCHILDGHIQDFHLFNQEKELTPKADKSKVEPTKNRIHCVIFVLDATTLDTVSEKVIEKMKQFQRLMNEREIPQLIVLTKIDKICNDVERDFSFTYKSWAVEEHVKKASQLLGLSQTKVFPVKNYKEETKLDNNVNILALLALSRILESVEDYMLNLLDRQVFGQIDLKKNQATPL
ncbi:interferon-induced protein 44-like [Ruditapes philippinarum]|uniref:interferon-induced protein 44-like n=1 Tax=Ruditapes philippinarum TaxID=129788 RepID=UPI00295AFD85|nr:interferon-induced protein 44-like [Ruditapes philippinarum]